MIFRKGKALVLAAALALAGLPAQAQVPAPFAAQLAHQLAVAQQDLGERGYSPVAGPFAGPLPPRLDRRVQLTLRAGQEYDIVGVCDGRCRAISVRVYDGNDDLLAANTLVATAPALMVRPRTTGLHTIEVTMDQCAAPECYYAFNLYAR